MRGKRLRGFLLRRAVVPEAVILGYDLDAGILLEDVLRPERVTLVDGVAGHAARQEDLALAAHRIDQRLGGVLAEAGGDVADVVGARLGDGRVIHEEEHALLAAAVDGAVQRGGGDREADDAVRPVGDHALIGGDLRLRIGAGDDLLQIHHLVVGRRLGERLDDVGGFALPGISGVAERQVDLELLVLRGCSRHGCDGKRRSREEYAHSFHPVHTASSIIPPRRGGLLIDLWSARLRSNW